MGSGEWGVGERSQEPGVRSQNKDDKTASLSTDFADYQKEETE